MLRSSRAQRAAEWALLLFVAAAILWRGGKSIDATWMLGITTLCVLLLPRVLPRLWRKELQADGVVFQPATVPFLLWGMPLFFLVWSGWSYVMSETRTYGLDELVRDASCVLLFLWIVRYTGGDRSRTLADRFQRVVMLAGVAATFFGLAVYVFQPVSRFTGSFLDWRFHTDYWPNAWAEFVLFSWPIVLLFPVRKRTIPRRLIGATVGGFLVGSLLLSYSRGGLIAFGGQLVLLVVLWTTIVLRDVRIAKLTAAQWKHVAVQYSVAVAVAILFFFGGNALRAQRYSVESVASKLTFTAAEGTSSIDERAQFWDQAMTLTLERPLFGYGPYSFRFAQPHLMQHVLATSDHPHNVFLKFAAERGLPAAIVFGLFLVAVIGLSLRHLFFDRKNDWSVEGDSHTIALLVAVLGVLAHNLIDYNLQFVGVALPLWIGLGFLSSHLAHKRPVSRASFHDWRLARGFGRIESVVILLLFVVIVWEGALLVTSSLGRRAEARGDWEQARVWYERSAREWFSRDLSLARASLLQREERLDEAEDVLRQSLEENAIDARAWRMRSDVALRRGDVERALGYADHAYQLGRYTDIAILRVLLDALAAASATDVLRERRVEFETLFGHYATAIEQNTHFIALGGAVEELELVGDQMSTLFPDGAVQYDAIVQRAMTHAQLERATYAARPRGLLW